MSSAANRAKTKWNAKNYVQVKASVEPGIAAAFKEACAASGVSMASALSEFMSNYSKHAAVQGPQKDPHATRRLRKRSLESYIAQIESLALAEEGYRDNIPENLKGSIRYEEADRSVAIGNEAIDLLREMY